MRSRARVMAAVGHEEVDRVPIDFGAMRSTGIMAIAYNRSNTLRLLRRVVRSEANGCTAGIPGRAGLPAV